MRFPGSTPLIVTLLTLSILGTAQAGDGTRPARARRATPAERLRVLADELARFSTTMGAEALKALKLGKPALKGLANGSRTIHFETDAAGVQRLWSLGTVADSVIEAGRVASIGEGWDYETTVKRKISLRRTNGRLTAVTSEASYNPRGKEGKSFHTVTVERALPFGFHVIEQETRRRQVAGGKVDVTVDPRSRSRSLSLGSVRIPLPARRAR
jgi:hypothetical protein